MATDIEECAICTEELNFSNKQLIKGCRCNIDYCISCYQKMREINGIECGLCRKIAQNIYIPAIVIPQTVNYNYNYNFNDYEADRERIIYAMEYPYPSFCVAILMIFLTIVITIGACIIPMMTFKSLIQTYILDKLMTTSYKHYVTSYNNTVVIYAEY